jgi:arsenite-transporting ATPase
MRIIVMCGKGGVGKTTLAAALGVKAAQAGKRTLVFSVDPAHSLSLAMDAPLGPQPVSVGPNLWAAELEAIEEVDTNWADVRDYFSSLMQSQGLQDRLGGEISSLPGINEFAALVKLKQFYDSGRFDTIVLDNAPTGFALRLLSLPEIFAWYAKHAIRLYEKHGPQLMLMLPMFGASVPMPQPGLVGKAMGLVEQLKDLPLIFADPTRTSTRLVLTPDRLALEEAKKAYGYLSLYGLNADAVIVNGVLPDAVQDPFFAKRREAEQAVRAQARALFAPLPVWEVPLQPHEATGLGALMALAASAWPEADPTAPLSHERAISITAQDGQLLVSIKLPFVASKDVDLAKFENELYITIGNHRRNLLLPPEARDMQPVKAKFTEGRLLVTLASPE